MPCPTLNACRPLCAHRATVDDYRLNRIAWEQAMENATFGYSTEMDEYRRTNPGPTFRDHLVGMARR